jgi:predicted DsbA family dithiol-disulfide isomerase
MTLTVWSDYVCPFAYVGFRRLWRASAGRPDAAVEWRPFELHPETPPGGVLRDRLQAGAAAHGAHRRSGVLAALLEEDGLTLRAGPVQWNSRMALAAAEYARDAGRFDALHERLFRAAFEEAADLGRTEVLRDLAAEVGLDGADLVGAVTAHRYLDRVVAGIEDAMALGITGTPSYRTPSGAVLRGVQPVTVLDAALAGAARDELGRETLR